MGSNNQKLVSIGIPFFNSEMFLANAINSVINQTYIHWELFLIDDGSNDKSLEIAKEFEIGDTRIKVLSDGKNLGLPARLNQLSQLASGKYYARMDADDMMHPERLAIQVNYLIENNEVDLLGTGLIAIDDKNNITGIRKGTFMKNFTLQQVLTTTWCVHPTITGKSEWFKNNPYDERMKRAQDYELWMRTVEQSNFVRLERPLLFYREASTPSLIKYFKSTQYSLKIFQKNRKKIGNLNMIKMSLIKIIKLSIYFLLSLFNATDKLIQRRSVTILERDKRSYQSILDKIK